MQWNLEQLRQFIAIVDHGSISAAARHLGKVQSAVSTAIALLEADLGVSLFDRSRHKVQLTAAGSLLLAEAKELLRQAEELDQRAKSFADGNDAQLTVAFDEALPYSAVRLMLRELSARSPELELTLLDGTATEVSDAVEDGRADTAFHFDRGPLKSCFDQRHIGAVRQGVFVAKGHPLMELKSVQKRDLARHRQILPYVADVVDIAYSPKVWRSDSFYNIAEMVADNVGWAVLPVNIAEYFDYSKSLVEVRCPSLAPPLLSVRMLWLQGRPLSFTSTWIGERLAGLLKP